MTVVDFWSVIWEERVSTIVMLANIKEGGKVNIFATLHVLMVI